MNETYDTIVLGIGGFGASAVDQLARRGERVLGIERFGVAHEKGSSHGETRIIRKAYFEHPDYVPLLKTAYRLWSELEQETGRTLYNPCGLLLAGPPEGETISGAKLAARTHELPIDELSLAEARNRFGGFRFDDAFAVLFETDAGLLFIEDCIRAQVRRAESHGAVVKTGESVIGWTANGASIRLRTDKGAYEAARLAVTAGPWASEMLADLSIPLEVVRKPLLWHQVTTADYNASTGKPAFFFEAAGGLFYGFPSLEGETIKVAEHSGGDPVPDPLTLDREIHETDVAAMSRFLSESVPGVRPRPVRHAMCMYTLTPDGHFLVDRHPEHENVVIGAGFSGHGFKFTPVIGSALADLLLEGRTELPIGFLSIDRPALRPIA